MQQILIVEDDLGIRNILKLFLNAKGKSTATASNGREALAYLFQHKPPQMILLDLQMPIMDGVEFLREKIRSSAIADIPVVLMSASEELEAVAGEFGLSFISKPMDLNVLVEVLDSVLAESATLVFTSAIASAV